MDFSPGAKILVRLLVMKQILMASSHMTDEFQSWGKDFS